MLYDEDLKVVLEKIDEASEEQIEDIRDRIKSRLKDRQTDRIEDGRERFKVKTDNYQGFFVKEKETGDTYGRFPAKWMADHVATCLETETPIQAPVTYIDGFGREIKGNKSDEN